MKLASVHRWVGLVLCASVLVMSVSGVLLLWKREYLLLSVPAAQAQLDVRPSSTATALNKIQASYMPDEATFVQLHSDNLSLHKVFLKGKRYAWHAQDGQQVEVWQSNERFEDWLLDLHHRFLLGNAIGLNIAGFSGIIMLPLMLVGLYLWWYRRRSWRIGLIPKYRSRDAWRISHGNLGLVFWLPISVLVITGVILVYPKESRTVLLDSFKQDERVITSMEHLERQPSLEQALNYAATYFPGSRARWVSLPNTESKQFSIGISRAGAWNSTGQSSLNFLSDGEVKIKHAQRQSRTQRVFDFSYPLHAGKLPWYLRFLLSLVGMALAALCVLGLRSYIFKYAKN